MHTRLRVQTPSLRRQRSRLMSVRDVSNRHTTLPQHHDNTHNHAHTQPRPKPRPTTQGHTVADNGVRGVKIEKPPVTTARGSENHGQTTTPQAKTTGQTTTHKKTTVKPQKTRSKPRSNHGHVLFFDGHGVTEGEPQTANPHTRATSHKPQAKHIHNTDTTYHAPQAHPTTHHATTPKPSDQPRQVQRAKPRTEPCHTTPHHTKSRHAKTGHAKNRPSHTKPGCVRYCSAIVWLNCFYFS